MAAPLPRDPPRQLGGCSPAPFPLRAVAQPSCCSDLASSQVLGSSRALSLGRLCCQLSLSSRVPRAQPSDPPSPTEDHSTGGHCRVGYEGRRGSFLTGAGRRACFLNEALLPQSITTHTLLSAGHGPCRGDDLNGGGCQGPCLQMQGGQPHPLPPPRHLPSGRGGQCFWSAHPPAPTPLLQGLCTGGTRCSAEALPTAGTAGVAPCVS